MWIKLGLLIATIICGYNLPADCLHPQSSYNTGMCWNAEGKRESYYYYQPYMVNYMREFGYSEGQ